MCVLMKKCRLVYIVLSLSVIALLASCDDSVLSRLSDVEAFINDRPDSALVVLESIPHTELNTRRSRAKYALLKSIALDKNYIDVTSDSIIAPAVSYYRHHGSADEKLKTFYYRGLISYNDMDTDAAMSYFVLAENNERKASDNIAKGRLHRMKQVLFSELFLNTEALAEEKQCLHYYEKAGDSARAFNCFMNIANIFMRQGLLDSAGVYLHRCESNIGISDEEQRLLYYSNLLEYDYDSHASQDVVERHLKNYLDNISDSLSVDYIGLAVAYSYLGKSEDAMSALNAYEKNNDVSDNQLFYSILSKVLYERGNYKNAFDAYSEYVRISDSEDLKIFESKAKYAQDVFDRELERRNMMLERFCVYSALFFIIIIVLVASIVIGKKIRLYRKEQTELKAMLEDAANEIEELKKIKENGLLDDNLLGIINERISLLNEYIKETMSGVQISASECMNSFIKDKEHFLESTRILFRFSHPKFMKYLEQHGLNVWEQSVCCLVLNGVQSKGLSLKLDYSTGTMGNKLSCIRKKLADGQDDRRELVTILKNICSMQES